MIAFALKYWRVIGVAALVVVIGGALINWKNTAVREALKAQEAANKEADNERADAIRDRVDGFDGVQRDDLKFRD